MPHGWRGEKESEKFAADQPIWLTDQGDNPNSATVIMLCHGASADTLDAYARACDIFDGTDETALAAARTRWKNYSDAGHAVTYWQQNERGGWEQKS